jgi:hypothetical protein
VWASEMEQLLWPFLAALPTATKQSILDKKQEHCSIIEEKQDNFFNPNDFDGICTSLNATAYLFTDYSDKKKILTCCCFSFFYCFFHTVDS